MKFLYAAAICLLISFNEIKAASVVGNENKHRETITYLKSYGYLPESKNSKEITEKELKHALKKLQVSCVWKIFWNVGKRKRRKIFEF